MRCKMGLGLGWIDKRKYTVYRMYLYESVSVTDTFWLDLEVD